MTTTPPPGPGPEGPAEHLDSAWSSAAPPSTGGRRTGVVVAGLAAVGVAAVGVGGWALVNFLATGAQPAEALPAGTLGYVSIDLDPGGAQKIEALQTLNKFEDFQELGLDPDDDIRQVLFEDAVECSPETYRDDIEPWLGERMAAAVVAAPDGSENPVDVVLVLQVSDDDAAAEAIPDLECGEESSADAGVTVADGWAIMGETQQIADRVAKAAESATLADDSDFQRWTGEAGSAGIVSMYAAPEAGELLADQAESGLEGYVGAGEETDALGDGLDALREFGGAAATIRFADEGVEVEFVGDSSGQLEGIAEGTTGSELVRTLPGDTALAFGTGLQEGWGQRLLDRFAQGESTNDLIDEIEQELGVTVPDDIEALFGDGFAVAVSGEADFDSVIEDGETVDGLPVGLKVAAPLDSVQPVLDRLTADLPPDAMDMLRAEAAGDTSVFALDEDYRTALAERGDLGEQARFRAVLPDAAKAGSLLYVDFDASWITETVADEADAPDVGPLAALGVAGWLDGDIAHGKVRLTTE